MPRFHGLTRTVDKIHATEHCYGLDRRQRRARFAVNIADGALEGPFGLGIGSASAKRSGLPGGAWGSLDGFHALDKAGAAADQVHAHTQPTCQAARAHASTDARGSRVLSLQTVTSHRLAESSALLVLGARGPELMQMWSLAGIVWQLLTLGTRGLEHKQGQ